MATPRALASIPPGCLQDGDPPRVPPEPERLDGEGRDQRQLDREPVESERGGRHRPGQEPAVAGAQDEHRQRPADQRQAVAPRPLEGVAIEPHAALADLQGQQRRGDERVDRGVSGEQADDPEPEVQCDRHRGDLKQGAARP